MACRVAIVDFVSGLKLSVLTSYYFLWKAEKTVVYIMKLLACS